MPENAELLDALEGEIRIRRFYATINTHNVVSLWPVLMENSDGKLDSYNASAHRAAERATEGKFIRVKSNRSLGAYEIHVAMDELPPPEWPDEASDIMNLVRIAFRDQFITDMDHPFILKIQGREGWHGAQDIRQV
jgi:hypothetical protein